MRLSKTLVTVMVVAAVAASGCLLPKGCHVYMRKAVWTQDAPIPSGTSAEYRFGDFWGGVAKHPETGEIHLDVMGNESVSHEELVEFGEAYFAKQGWPPPQLANAQEYSGCNDHL
jgi:hypothetical protein